MISALLLAARPMASVVSAATFTIVSVLEFAQIMNAVVRNVNSHVAMLFAPSSAMTAILHSTKLKYEEEVITSGTEERHTPLRFISQEQTSY